MTATVEGLYRQIRDITVLKSQTKDHIEWTSNCVVNYNITHVIDEKHTPTDKIVLHTLTWTKHAPYLSIIMFIHTHTYKEFSNWLQQLFAGFFSQGRRVDNA